MSVKAQLIEHAALVFRQKGFNGASVQDITTSAGVPKGSFYNHFASKQVLAAEIMERYAVGTDFGMLAEEGPYLDRLRRHFAVQSQRTEASGVEFGCLMATFAGDSPTAGDKVRTAVRGGLDAWVHALAEVIEAGQRVGEISSVQPARDFAAFLIDAFEGGALRSKVTGDPAASMNSLELALRALQV